MREVELRFEDGAGWSLVERGLVIYGPTWSMTELGVWATKERIVVKRDSGLTQEGQTADESS